MAEVVKCLQIPLLKKKKEKSKEYSTRFCGQSTAPCGHLSFQLTVWPAWLPCSGEEEVGEVDSVLRNEAQEGV